MHEGFLEWVIRLGDGTEESKEKVQKSINDLWMWTGELFEKHPLFETLGSSFIDFSTLKTQWLEKVALVLETATLLIPDPDSWMQTGGRLGVHTSHLGFILAEMQSLPRTHPNASW